MPRAPTRVRRATAGLPCRAAAGIRNGTRSRSVGARSAEGAGTFDASCSSISRSATAGGRPPTPSPGGASPNAGTRSIDQALFRPGEKRPVTSRFFPRASAGSPAQGRSRFGGHGKLLRRPPGPARGRQDDGRATFGPQDRRPLHLDRPDLGQPRSLVSRTPGGIPPCERSSRKGGPSTTRRRYPRRNRWELLLERSTARSVDAPAVARLGLHAHSPLERVRRARRTATHAPWASGRRTSVC